MIVGLHVKGSTSKETYQELANKHANQLATVTTNGYVTSYERTWKLANSQAALYPIQC